MPKVLLKFKQKKRFAITVLGLLFFTSVFAQDKMAISFGDKINLGEVGKETKFSITGPTGNIHLNGTEINDYNFPKPGSYVINVDEHTIHPKEKCTEMQLPKSITVDASRVKMTFDANVLLSSPILKNKDTEGIILNIPVAIKTFDHRPAQLNFSPVNSAGIGTHIIAKLQTDVAELPEGTHMLHYNLSGVATENAYIMFDFIDANSNIQPISLPTPIIN